MNGDREMALTTGSLRHPNLRARLHGAMIRAAAASRINANGAGGVEVGSIYVMHFRGRVCGHTGFHFAHGLDDVTGIVLRALREPEPLPDGDGWRG